MRLHRASGAARRAHETAEYHFPRPRALFPDLRRHFDPGGRAHCLNAHYGPRSLLLREALR